MRKILLSCLLLVGGITAFAQTGDISGTQTICRGASANLTLTLTGTGPWNVTLSDGSVFNGIATSPFIATVSPIITTTYTISSLTDVGTATTINAPSPSLTGSATVTVTLNGVYTIGTDFATIASAVTYLNTNGVCGSVTFNVPAGYTETAPAGGISITASTASANPTGPAATVTFIKSGAGANPLVTAFAPQTSGSVMDAVIKLVGADYITINGVDVRENASNTNITAGTNNMTEFGYALFYNLTNNGAKNNTVQNCTISLDKSYTNTFGIYSNTNHSSTSASTGGAVAGGENSTNKIYTNTISNVNYPIVFSGIATAMDDGNDIGGSSGGTQNTATNYSSGSAAVSAYNGVNAPNFGIYLQNQTTLNVSYNSLTSSNTTRPSTSTRGIFLNMTAAPTGTFTNTISNNTITTYATALGANNFEMITATGTGVNTMTLAINNNQVLNSNINGAGGSSTVRGIYSNLSAAAAVSIQGNSFTGMGSVQTGGSWRGIENTTPATGNITISTNSFSGNSVAVVTTWYGIINSAASANLSITGNTVGGITFTGALAAALNFNAITNTGSFSTSGAINTNTITGITFSSSVSTWAAASGYIYNSAGAAGSSLSINSNVFQNISNAVASTTTFSFITNTANIGTQSIQSNEFKALSFNTTGSITFITNSTTATVSKTVSSNFITTSFAKTAAGGTLTFYTDAGATGAGVTVTNSNNNFSNISVTGATIIAGWTNTDGGAGTAVPNKTISNNTFGNITGGSSGITLINITKSVTTAVSNNTISTVSGSGSCTGISFTGVSSTALTANSNAISGVTGITTFTGMSFSTGTTAGLTGNTVSGTISPSGNSSGIVTTTFTTSTTLAANTVSGITVSAGTCTGISISSPGTTVSVTGSTVTNLTSSSTLRGIDFASGTITTLTASSNTVTGLNCTGTGAVAVTGMTNTFTTTTNATFSYNKIGNISSSSLSGAANVVTGIIGGGGTSFTCVNNIIGDLRATSSTNSRGIIGIDLSLVGGTMNIYYNTIYLFSSNANVGPFGSTCLYASSTPTINLRNNILVNTSTTIGAAGFTAAYSRTTVSVTTHSSVSDNNLFYAGTPGTKNVIYLFDAANNDQTVTAFSNRVNNGAELNSVTELPPFFSTTASSANFLHLTPGVATQAESGAVNIGGITDDYDLQIRQGNVGYTGASTTGPDIGADEQDCIATDITPPGISYTPIANNPTFGASFSPGTNFTITDTKSGVNTTAGTKPRLYYKKCADSYSVINNTAGADGWKWVEATNSSSPFNFTFDYSILKDLTGEQGSVIQYFVVAQDNAATPNVGYSNNLTYQTTKPTSVNLVAANLPASTSAFPSFVIQITNKNNYTVGANGSFVNLTGSCGCFRSVNASNTTMNTNITVSVISNLSEPNADTVRLRSGGIGNAFTVSVVPSSATSYVISGDKNEASPGTGNNMITVMTGARLTIDGNIGGTRYLTLRNEYTTNAANTMPTIGLGNGGNGATQLNVSNCFVEGNNNNTSGVGVISAFESGTSASVVTINNSHIRKSPNGNPGVGIYLNNNNLGSVTIQNSELYNFQAYGIYFFRGGATNTITGNSLYQPSAITSSLNTGIFVGTNASAPFSITNNYIGGSAVLAAGTWTNNYGSNNLNAYGIYLNRSNTATGAHTVTGNTIQNISITAGSTNSLTGIYINESNSQTHNISTNTIQNLSMNNGTSNSVYGIVSAGTIGATVNGNTINGLTNNGTNTATPAASTFGIQVNNTISSSVSNNNISSLTANGTGTWVNMKGIYVTPSAAAAVYTISGNTVSDLTSFSSSPDQTANAGAAVSGIELRPGLATTTGHIISGNTVYNIKSDYTATAANTYAMGIMVATNVSNNGTLRKNKVYNIINNATGAAARIIGITLTVGGNAVGTPWTVSNNMVSLNNLNNVSNNPLMYGIRDAGLSSHYINYYYNSVHIFGNGNPSGTNNTYGFFRENVFANGTNINLTNNIFQNIRTGGTGKHYAIANLINGTAANGWVSSSYNLLFSSTASTLGLWGTTIVSSDRDSTAWVAVSAGDVNSVINDTVTFIDPTNGDLHTTDLSIVNRATAISITDDYDAVNIRTGSCGRDIGADEIDETSVGTANTWLGTTSSDWCTACNWSKAAVPLSTQDVIIPARTRNILNINNNSCTQQCKNFTINGNATMTLTTNGTLNVYGDYSNYGFYNHTGTGTLAFRGSLLQTVNSVNTLTIVNLTMNQGAGGSVTLNTDATMSGTLALTNGIITVNTGKIFAFTPTATYTGGSNTSYVDGKMRQIVRNAANNITAFTLPVGKNGYFGPVGTSGLTGTAVNDYFDGEYFLAYPGSIYSVNYNGHLSPPVYHASMIEYWNLVPNNNAINGKTVLYYPDNVRSAIYDQGRDTLRVLNWNGTQWVDLYNTAAPSVAVPALPANRFITSSDNALTGWGKFTFGTTQTNPGLTILPTGVKLFEAVKQNGYNNLHWEVSCSGKELKFEVQRSKDGRSFETLNSFTASQTRCSQPFDYRDYNALGEKIYYRIRITDENGKVLYTQVALIINKKSGVQLTGVLQNPVHNDIVVNLSSAAKEKIELIVTDMQGRIVARLNTQLNAGSNLVRINAAGMAAGVYNLVLVNEGINSLRIVKQ